MAWVGEQSEQQKNVYKAQELVGRGQVFSTYEAAQAFADSLTSSHWWETTYSSIVAIEVQPAPEGEPATGRLDTDVRVAVAEIPKSMLNERVLLHEVAHAIAPPECGHSATWVREFMSLMYRALGSDRYFELFTAFKKHNVEMD